MRLTILSAALLMVGGTAGAQTPKQESKKMEDLIGEARGRMSGVFETKDFQEKIPFSKFLQLLEKEIAKEKPFAIHFDREAFGKDADKMLNTEVNLPPVPARMVFNTALRLALAQTYVEGQEIEFTARPGTLIITTRDRSLFTVTHEIGDLLKHTRYLHDSLRESNPFARGVFFLIGPEGPDFDLKADPAKPDEWFVRQAISLTNTDRAGWRNRTPASTIRIANGTKLIVHTVPSVHDEIGLFLATLRRLNDLAVAMNARLYAIDRAEYDAQFAGGFVDHKDKSARLAAKATDAQRKLLQARKPILESDADKLRPNERAVFLAQRNAYQFQEKPGDAKPTIAFEGFSFSVRPTVSPDRRCLRLEIFHVVEQLVKLTKGAMIDLKTGKESPIELPNLRKSALSGTIEIHDTHAILIAVDYRPKDKVWLLLAEPRIYIEEEEEYIRKGAIKPMPLADEKPPPPAEEEKPYVPPPLVELPGNDDVKQILQAIVENVLTDPEHKKVHSHYGTPGDAKFTLLTGYTLNWPKNFRPVVAGFTYQQIDPDECRSFKKRLLGIRVDTFDWTPNEKNPKSAKVVVVLDDAIHGALGALRIVYHAKRDGKRWKVEWTEAFTH
jgi:hypothetical protein